LFRGNIRPAPVKIPVIGRQLDALGREKLLS
jgi:hypothetical protein